MTHRALMLSPELPYPLAGGGALRTASLLNYLAQHHTVDLIVFRHLDSQLPLASLPPGLVDRALVLELPRHGRGRLARTARNARRLLRGVPPLLDRFQGFGSQIADFAAEHHYRVAVVEHFWCAPYLPILAPHVEATVLNLHNIESALHLSEARSLHSLPERLAHRYIARLYRGLEQQWLPRYSEILTASEPDRARVAHLNPQSAVFPNSIPCRPVPAVPEEHVIAFSGNFDYHPNRTAVAWFASQVWPPLARAYPHLRWRLIGMNPESVRPVIRHLPRVELTGPVPDAVEELARAQTVIVPLLSGSGTRLKIVEAWAAQRPVLSTPIGAEGLPAESLMIAPPRDFLSALSALLADPTLRSRLGSLGRSAFERSLTWNAAWDTLLPSQITPIDGGTWAHR